MKSNTRRSSGRLPATKANAGWNPGLYDSKHSFVWQRAADLLELLAPRPGERILDLGCGTGHLTAQIARSGACVVGIDRSPAMIADARKNYPGIEFHVADARRFRFPQPFDAVFSNAALHWIREPEKVIGAVWRALVSGGRFVLEMGGKGNIHTFTEAFEEALQAVGAARAGNRTPWFFPSVAEYAALLEKRGFEIHSASLFDRPTLLDDGEAGLNNWIEMFGASFLARVKPARKNEFLAKAGEILRPKCFHDGRWIAGYRRLRIVAAKL